MGVGRRKLVPFWVLALALACSQHTGQAQQDTLKSSHEHLSDFSHPQGHVGTPLNRVTIIPPLKTFPVVRALNPAHTRQVCSTWGNFHYKTFDGQVFYFPGLCNYVFSAHCGDAYEDFNIQLRRGQESNSTTLSRVTMKLDGLVVELTKSSVLVNNHPVQLPFSQSGVLIELSNGYLKVVARLGLLFMWNDDDSLLLELDTKYTNKTCGLCGDFNGSPKSSEFLSHNVRLTPLEFGNLQKMDGPTEQCQDPLPVSQKNCSTRSSVCEKILKGQLFSDCAALVDISSYLEACQQDLCLCESSDPSDCICHTLAEYSRQCTHAGGQPQDWRGPNLCPQTCPLNMQHQECGTPCVDTCSNPQHSQVCEDHCVAGCFCPEGMVLDDINQTGCVPVSQCACLYNGTFYAPGTNYSTDCTKCTCSGGQWSCQEVPCSGACSVLGGSHISTFDERQYTVHGDCTYVLSKPCNSNVFTVLAELRKCGLTESETCLKTVTLNLGGGQMVVMVKATGEVFVNQIYTQLPVSTANVTFFRPSTFFIIGQTNLGLQLEIQLNPIMQVSVRLTPELRGLTCGLCGNFNSMQADDFQTISGVVEGTAAAFFNTFKTQAACPNVKNIFEDPCSLSVENEKYAQHWCSQLTNASGPFSQCHATVNPSTFFSNCMFDTCNCEKSEDCMCAALSSYVRACAAKGVLLSDWRDGICTKPAITCPKSMTYQYHISTCQPTCRSLTEEDVTCHVNFIPVDGCTCPKGTFLDDSGKCVQATSCPCYYKGSTVPNGESVHDSGTICTCTQGALTCIGGPAPTPVCDAPMIYFDCRNATSGGTGAGCQKSCHTLDMTCYSSECVPGCVCPNGLVADGNGGCVVAEDCPCVHNEATYRPGETIQVGCNNCTCENRMWQCTDKPCLATCAVYGDGHYITFDGQRYSFNGDCEYTLLQDNCGGNGSSQHAFRVVTENIPCGTTGTTCSKGIKIFLGNYELKLSDSKMEVVQKDVGQEPPYFVHQMGNYLVVETDIGLVLLWDKKTSIFLRLSPEFKGKVCGLCGNFDDNAINDFTTRSQSVVSDMLEFGNSWKLSPSCPDVLVSKDPCTANPYRKSWAQKQCSIINSATFSACHAHVEPAKYYEACVNDACACDSGGDCECFCTAVAAYAQACHEVGVCVSWRTPDICPLFCDYYNPEGQCEWHYQPCGAPCMRTCQNPTGQCLQDLRGLEGCYPKCPPTAPIFDEGAMQCVSNCTVTPSPIPPQPCRVNGKLFWPGASVPSDKNCQSCICTESGVNCTHDAGACVCIYNGQQYHPGDIIYHTTDGMGGCISAHCLANGTIDRRVDTCSSTTSPPPTTFSFSTPLVMTSMRPSSTHSSPTPSVVYPGSPSKVSPTTSNVLSVKTPATGPILTTTSASTVTTSGCQEECLWSPWMDVSRPGRGIDSGDFDTLENLRAHGYQICQVPKAVECRAEDSPEVPLHMLQQHLECSTTVGLTCYNRDQESGLCDNYQIKVQCCTPISCPTSSGPTQTTNLIASRTTTIGDTTSSVPVTSTEHAYSTVTSGPSPSSSVPSSPAPAPSTPAPVTSTTVKTTLTTTSPTPKPTPATSSVSISTSGSTRASFETTHECKQELCHWTDWIDGSYPGPSRNSGDFDTFVNLRSKGYKFCEKPRNVECRAQFFPNTPLEELGQDVICNREEGLLCLNKNQLPPICYNYEIRIECCTVVNNCSTDSTTRQPPSHGVSPKTKSSWTTTMYSSSTKDTRSHSAVTDTKTLVSGSPHTTTQPVTTHCQPQCHWTKWFDTDFPVPGPHGGDLETYSNILRSGERLCHRPEEITQLQCRAENSPEIDIKDLGQVVQCDPSVGLVCNNRDQEGNSGMCLNYEVRVLCCHVPEGCPTTTHATLPSTPSETVTSSAPGTTSMHRASSTSMPQTRTNIVQTHSTTSAPHTSSPATGKGSTTHQTQTSSTPIGEASTSSGHTASTVSTRGIVHKSTRSVQTASTTSTPQTSSTSKGRVSTTPRPQSSSTHIGKTSTTSTTQSSTTSGPTASTVSTRDTSTSSGHTASPTSKPKATSTSSTISPRDTRTSSLQTDSTTSTSQTSSPNTGKGSTAHKTQSSSTPIAETSTISTSPSSGQTAHTTFVGKTSTLSVPGTSTTSVPTSTTGSTLYSEVTYSPVTTHCQPQCNWTKWFDTDFPVPGPHGGDLETYSNILRSGERLCHRPEEITQLQCRAENSPEIDIKDLGQVVQCDPSVGLVCNNRDQEGESGMCLNYEVRVLCCHVPEGCPTTTHATLPSTPSETVTSSTPGTTSMHRASSTSMPQTRTNIVQTHSTTSAPHTSSPATGKGSTTHQTQTSSTPIGEASTSSVHTASTTSIPKLTSRQTASTVSTRDISTKFRQTASTTSTPQTSPPSKEKVSTTPRPQTSSTPIGEASTSSGHTASTVSTRGTVHKSTRSVQTASTTSTPQTSSTSKGRVSTTPRPQSSSTHIGKTSTTSTTQSSTTSGLTASTVSTRDTSTSSGHTASPTSKPKATSTSSTISPRDTRTSSLQTDSTTSTSQTSSPNTGKGSTAHKTQSSSTPIAETRTISTSPSSGQTAHTTFVGKTSTLSVPGTSTTSVPTSTTGSTLYSEVTYSPVTTHCQPQCNWTKWFDTDFPVPGPHGGDLETYSNILRSGERLCHRPEEITQLQCRAENSPEIDIKDLGQVVQCDPSVGLVCNNRDQEGDSGMCLNYEVRVLCCHVPEGCPTTTHATLPSIPSETVTSSTPGTTSMHRASSTSMPQTRTNIVQTHSTTSAPHTSSPATGKGSTTHQTQTSSTPIGEASTSSGHTASTVSTRGIVHKSTRSVQTASTTSTPQTSSTSKGRVSTTPRPQSSSTHIGKTSTTSTTQSSTTSGPTASTVSTRDTSTSSGHTASPTSKPKATSTSSTISPRDTRTSSLQTDSTTSTSQTSSPNTGKGSTAHKTQSSSTPIAETSTISTSPSSGQTAHTTFVGKTSTLSVPGTSTTSVPTSTTGSTLYSEVTYSPVTTHCQPQCNWTKWFDTDFPVPGPHGGDLETYSNILRSGERLCHRPEEITQLQCRAENSPEIDIKDLGQVVQCDPSVGLVCNNRDQEGESGMCLNYEVRVLCCHVPEGCPTTTHATLPSTPSETVTSSTPGTTSMHRASSTSMPQTRTNIVQTHSTTSAPHTSSPATGKGSTTHQTQTSSTPIGEASTSSVHTASTTSIPKLTSRQTASTVSTRDISTKFRQTASTTSTPQTSPPSKEKVSTTPRPQTSSTPIGEASTSSGHTASTVSTRGTVHKSTRSVQTASTTSTPQTSSTSKGRVSTTPRPQSSSTHIGKTSTTSTTQSSTTSGLTASTVSTRDTSTSSGHTASPTSKPKATSTSSTISPRDTRTSSLQTDSTTSTSQTSSPNTGKGSTAHKTQSSSTPIAETRTISTSPSSGQTAHTTFVGKTSTLSVPGTSTTSVPTSTTGSTLYSEVTYSPVTTHCQPQCNWTKWFDTDFPVPGPHGGDLETYSNILRSGERLCHRPEEITQLQCRAENSPEIDIKDLGQVVQCDPSVGLVCNNRDQEGDSGMCLNYEVRVLCCHVPEGCPTTTHATLPSIPSETVTSSTPGTTSMHRASSTSMPQTRTNIVQTHSTTSAPHTSSPATGKGSTAHQTQTSSTPIGEASTSSVHTASTTSIPKLTSRQTASTVSTRDISTKFRQTASTTSTPQTSPPSKEKVSTTPRPQTSSTPIGEASTSSGHTASTVSTRGTVHKSTRSVQTASTTSTPQTSSTSKGRVSTTPRPQSSSTHIGKTSTTSTTQSSTTSGPIASTVSTRDTSTSSGHTASPTSKPKATLTSSTISPRDTRTSSLQTDSTTSTSQTSSPNTGKGSTAHKTQSSSTPIAETSTISTSPSSGQTAHTTFVGKTSTLSGSGTSTTSIPTSTTGSTLYSEVTYSPVTTHCQPQCNWTKWFDTDFPVPGPHGGDLETYSNILRSGERLCHRPEEITQLQCRAENSPEIDIKDLGQVVQCDPSVGLVCNNRDQEGESGMCLNYEVRVLCCHVPEGCPGTDRTPVTLSHKPSFPVVSPTSVSPSLSTSPRVHSTTPCFCSVSGQLYPLGSIIYNQTDLDGYCYYSICSQDCQVVKRVSQACPSTMPPPTPTLSTSTTPPVTEQDWCNVFPPRLKGETWPMPNCSQVTCEGNNVISLSPRQCPELKEPSCANGYPPLKVDDQDGCCQHYQCQCVCSGWGDPHYITFDGTYYTFLDNCTYVLVQQIVPVFGYFRVLIDNYFCDLGDSVTCPQSIIVEYHQDRVVLTRRPVSGVMTNQIIFNNKVVSPGFQHNGIVVSRMGIKMYVTIQEIGVRVMFSGLIFSVEVPFNLFANNTEGQCGTCTNDKKDECRLPGGSIASSCAEMSHHWKVPNQPSCQGPPPTPTSVVPKLPPTPCPPSPLCQLIISDVFKLCHDIIPPRQFYEGCLFDSCHKLELEVFCSALELYASLCAAQGVCIPWRSHTNNTCSFTCSGDKVYQPCGPSNPHYCYRTDDISPSLLLQEAGPKSEGCFCPDNMTLFSTNHSVCVPSCQWCLGPHGEPVEPGRTISIDCQDCVCKEATLTCRRKLCPQPTCPEPGFVPMPVALEAGQCCPQYSCACNSSHCPPPLHCPENSSLIVTYEEGACCPSQNCSSQKGCEVNGTLYQPGDVVSSGLCERCLCEVSSNPLSGVFMVNCETELCNTQCPKGFEYQAMPGQCCGQCVQKTCPFKNSSNSTHYYKPGELWSEPGNPCITHKCEKFQDVFVVVTTKTECPKINCPPGQAQLREDGCCYDCLVPQQKCTVHQRQQIIRQQNCSSEGPVSISYCQGNCGDSTSMYSLEANTVEHTCECCQELQTSQRSVTLRCDDGSSRTFSYTQVEKCGCLGQRCQGPGDTSHAEFSEQEFKSKESEEHGQQSAVRVGDNTRGPFQ